MANRALTARIETQDTGRLRVGRGSSVLSVSVWDGEVVAATSTDDLRHLLRRLLLEGEIDAERVQELLERANRREPVFGTLLDEADPQVLEEILEDRFRENLTRFLGSAAKPRFTHLPAIYADNFQSGHHAATLLQSCADAWDDAMSVELDMPLYAGTAPPRSDLHAVVLQRVGGGTTVSQILVQLPAEPFSARALLARMLRSRMLDTENAPEADTASHHGPQTAPLLNIADDVDLGDPVAETYVPDDDTPLSVSEVLPEEDRRTLEEDLAPSRTGIQDMPTVIDEPDDELGAYDEDEATEEVDLSELDVESVAPDEDAADEAAPGEGATAETNEGAGDLSSLEAWMDHGIEVEDDLDAFGDHGEGRGDEEAGRFTTDQHNLDRVEVVPTEDEPLEMSAAPTAKFGAPVLSDGDARAKIEVANGVLSTIAGAFDAAEGNGRGSSVVQLGLEGSPGPYQALFKNLRATDAGELPEPGVLRNLHLRPAPEHRRLLNQGLLNLIERVLSLAAEELPDEAFDTVLERVAGYRKRLGI